MGSTSSHTSEMTLALSRGLCLSPPCVPKRGVRCCHHPSGPWRTSRVIPALFNPSHVGCGGLRKLQWDIPTSGVEFDGGEFGFWGLSAAPHEQSLRCDPTWPRTLGCPGGSALAPRALVGSGMCGDIPIPACRAGFSTRQRREELPNPPPEVQSSTTRLFWTQKKQP